MIFPRKEKEKFSVKRFFNEYKKRLAAGAFISVLFAVKLIPYWVLIICFLILALYEKNEKTESVSKKKGIATRTVDYIAEQQKTNPPLIFWVTVFVIVFSATTLIGIILKIISWILP